MRIGRLVLVSIVTLLGVLVAAPDDAFGRGGGGKGGKGGGKRGGKGKKGLSNLGYKDRKDLLKILEEDLYTADREDRFDGRRDIFDDAREACADHALNSQRRAHEDASRSADSRAETPR